MTNMKRICAAAIVLVIAVVYFAPAGGAHGAITSRFTYNGEIYPIVLNRCSRCHVDGGVGPMSLLSYEDAYPWAEAVIAELLDAGFNPSNDFIKAAHRQVSARELDILLEWSIGRWPEGDATKKPEPPAPLKVDWAQGDPQLTIPLPKAYEMPADVTETTEEFVLPIEGTAARDLTSIDLLPGTPAIVRDVVLSIKSGSTPAKTVATWTPRQSPAPLVIKPAIRLAPGSQVVAKIHYKKTWKHDGKPMTDRSTVGLYFAK